jgi:hypothetical protein
MRQVDSDELPWRAAGKIFTIFIIYFESLVFIQTVGWAMLTYSDCKWSVLRQHGIDPWGLPNTEDHD